MMAYLALRDGFPARAAAVFGAFTDMASLFREHPEVYQPLGAKIWPDFAARRDEILADRSAVLWAQRLRAPLLIMHGGADGGVNPSHGLRPAQRLQELGAVYELVIYAEDDHTLTRHRVERDAQAGAWFQRNGKPAYNR